jgi:hypothetical protein
MTDKGIGKIVHALEEANAGQELILDAITDFNPVLKSPLLYDVVDHLPTWLGGMAITATDSFAALELILESVDNIFNHLTGNALLDEENRREMIAAMAKRSTDSVASSPADNSGKKEKSSIKDKIADSMLEGTFAGLAAVIGANFTKIIPGSVMTMLSPILGFLKSFGKFAKVLGKFAGPIAIIVTAVVGIIGAIQGGMEGFKTGGVDGAIKGALTGLVDALLGDIMWLIGKAGKWLLELIGLDKIGGLFEGFMGDWLGGILKSLEGFVDIFTGIFTLDSDLVIIGLKKIVNAIGDVLKSLGKLIIAVLPEILPTLWKGIKGAIWGIWKAWEFIFADLLPKIVVFIMDLGVKIWNEFFPFLGEKISNMWTGIKEGFGKTWDGIYNWFMAALSWENISAKFEEGLNIADSVFPGVKQWIEDLIDGILTIFDDPSLIISGIKDQFSNMANMAEEFGKSILRAVLPEKKGRDWKDPLGWIAKAIPPEVYAYANTPPPKKEEDLKPSGPRGAKRGADFNYSQQNDRSTSLQSSPSRNGETLVASGANTSNNNVTINQMGGNVSNTNVRNVSNSTSSFEPIMTGSSLGLLAV